MNIILRFLTYCLSLVLVINSLLLGLANAAKFEEISSNLPQDVLAICTGSTVKYISEVEYLLSGNIVEIELSELNGEQDRSQFDKTDICPVDSGLEKTEFPQTNKISEIYTILAFVGSKKVIGQQPHSSFAFVLLPSRAPPSLK